MSKRTEVVVLLVLAVACGGAFYAVANQTVVPMAQSGPGSVQVTGSGWLQLLLSGLGAAGFSSASVWVILRNVTELLPKQWSWFGKSAVDVGQIATYVKLYEGEQDTAAKAKLAELGRVACDGMRDRLFPVA